MPDAARTRSIPRAALTMVIVPVDPILETRFVDKQRLQNGQSIFAHRGPSEKRVRHEAVWGMYHGPKISIRCRRLVRRTLLHVCRGCRFVSFPPQTRRETLLSQRGRNSP